MAEPLNTATRGHHPDSPSSLQSSEACAAFLNEQRESEAAAAGTLCHKATETRDLTLLDGDEDQERAVQLAIDYEDAVLFRFVRDHKDFQIVRESYLSVGSDEKVKVTPPPQHTPPAGGKEFYDWFRGVTGGFPDIEIVGTKHAAILDWKYGKVPVTPTKNNLQGIAYVLGRFEKSPSLETIEMHFFHPFQGWSEEEQRTKYVHFFSRSEIPALELRIRTVIARKHEAYKQVAQGDWTMAQPKHDLCLWCSRKGLCKKVGAITIQANEKYSDLVVPAEIKEYRLTKPEQVAHAYRFANQLQTICEAIKKRCVDAALTEDLKPDGFTIVKVQKRSVTSVQTVLNTAAEHGLEPAEITELLTVPLTKLEDALKAKAEKGKGAAKVRAFAQALNECGATILGTPFYFLREIKAPAEKMKDLET